MIDRLQAIGAQAVEEIRAAGDTAALEALRVRYLGRKGELTACLKGMGRLDPAERPRVGKVANEVKAAIEAALAERKEALRAAELERRLAGEAVDVTLPGLRG
ncbi:MAG: phenylalanine--tRNA ligase subunit alpha, partial [Deltaproteobacteria bacterium]|nr:phenylalanine--tRNA ligase subunit alpha [Deltaproteobacteria bacterium]